MKKRNKILNKEKISSLLGLLIVIFLFIFFSILTQKYSSQLNEFVGDSYLGMLVYVLLIIIEGILAPLSFIPLIAVASNLWGWVLTGFLSLFAWTIASVIVYFLVKKYGICLIKNIIPLDKLTIILSYVPEKNVFLGLILLRSFLPSDLLNYAISFFTNINFRIYFWSALIGGIPFAFGIAYLGVIPLFYQIISLFIGLLVISGILYLSSKNKKRLRRLNKLRKQFKIKGEESCKTEGK